jgi:hypothetical protein
LRKANRKKPEEAAVFARTGISSSQNWANRLLRHFFPLNLGGADGFPQSSYIETVSAGIVASPGSEHLALQQLGITAGSFSNKYLSVIGYD